MPPSDSAMPLSAPHLSMDLRAALQHTCSRHVTVMFKEMLLLLEKLAKEHDETLGKLYAKLPSEYKPYVELADYFTEDKAERLRSEVLSRGNDCKRAIVEEMEKYDVTFKQHP